MRYRIIFDPRASQDLDEIFEYICRQNHGDPSRATAWLLDAHQAVRHLELIPNGHGFAREAQVLKIPLRQLIYKSHRFIFQVDEQARSVLILHVRHAARQPAPGDDLRPSAAGESDDV